MNRLLVLLPVLLLSLNSLASYITEGKVIDQKTKEPLAFVSIVIKGTQKVTYTTIEGKFKISSDAPVTDLIFSYVGYTLLNYHVDSPGNLLIKMEQKEVELTEIKVVSGENPAHRIIRLASLNRKKNDPDHIPSYYCQIYTKTHYDLVRHHSEQGDSLSKDTLKASVSAPKKESETKDSSALFLKKLINESHIIMMESVEERKYLAPHHLNQTVLATKVSGLKHPSFSTTANDLQPFSFYGDHFSMLDKDYLNPITSGSTRQYFFQLEDTLYQEKDTVFIISFRPLKDKNFNGLQGVLYINTNQYAIQNVIASPFDPGLMDLRIQQQYQLVDNKQWFPQQLNYELSFKNYPSKKMGMKLTGKSFITEVTLDTLLRKRDFSFTTVMLDPEAAYKDSSYWYTHRQDTLSLKETLTYHLLDSVGEKNNFDKKLKLVEALTTLQIPVSIFNLDLNRIVGINDYETFRLGMGAHTNDRLSRWFNVGGYAGYGFKDKVVKYGADAILYLKRNSKDYYIKYVYANDIAEPGKSTYFYSTTNSLRNLLTYRMDHIEQQEVSINFRALKYLTANIALNQNTRKPNYQYDFYENPSSAPANPTFRALELRVKGRYAYKEKLVQSFGQLISSGSKYPVIHFAYSSGFKTPGYGDYLFNKFSVGLEKTFLIKHLGKTSILLEAGKVAGNVPYPYLFNGNGSFTKDGYLYVNRSFQTMGLYEFLSDQYANLFFSHNFGSLLFKTKKHQPEIIVFTSAGYGSLSDSTRHQQLVFKTMKKGFYESGVVINNILKVNYLNIAYLGIGGGVFMRYGAYAYKRTEDNVAYKLSFTITF